MDEPKWEPGWLEWAMAIAVVVVILVLVYVIVIAPLIVTPIHPPTTPASHPHVTWSRKKDPSHLARGPQLSGYQLPGCDS